MVGLAVGLDDLLGHRLVGRGQEAVGRDLAGAGDGLEGELGPDDRRHRQQLAGAGVHAGQAAGHAGLDRLGQGAGVDGGQGGAHVAEQLGEEEGVSLGSGPEGLDHGGAGQDAPHRVEGEPVEDLVGDVGVARQVGEQRRHRVGPVDRGVAVRADDQHRHLAGGGEDVLEEPDGGAMGPVEVVDDQQDRRAHGQLGDEAGGGVEELQPVVGQRGDVRRPDAQGGGDVGQHAVAGHHLGGGCGRGPAQDLGDGRVRRRGVGGAGAPQHPPAGTHHLAGHPLDEGGLAHPRLAGQQDNLAPATERSAPGLVQLLNIRLAADEGGKAAPLAFDSIHGGPTDTCRHPRRYRRPPPPP